MTVFMGTRQRYQLSRFELHSNYSIGFLTVLIFLLILMGNVKQQSSVRVMTWAGVMTTGLVSTKQGRKVGRRLVREVFYGSLFRFTCVFHTTGAKRVGK